MNDVKASKPKHVKLRDDVLSAMCYNQFHLDKFTEQLFFFFVRLGGRLVA